jgi:hypothetical protein
MVSKELFKDDNKDILVIQDQNKNMEECLLKDENIASAVDASDMDLAKTLSAKHCLNFQHYFKFHAALFTLYQQKTQKLQDSQGDVTINLMMSISKYLFNTLTCFLSVKLPRYSYRFFSVRHGEVFLLIICL